ncbi:hypothetical protein BDZ45DRAFT_801786 [Acephala macrosclerotiorum]|nr:hypothetical protein BDZ45DRAFT_801786 [Acephala macrosclerotiorum]
MHPQTTQLGWALLLAVWADATLSSCWVNNLTQEFVVGFDIGVSYGAVSVAFPNGSILDILRLEAGPAHQALVLQRLQDEDRVQIDNNLQEDFGLVAGQSLREHWWQRTIPGLASDVAASWSGYSTTSGLLLGQSELGALIVEMKTQTEQLLGHSLTRLTVTTPSFFTDSFRLDLRLALRKASLNISLCGDIEDSAIASTIATRFSQFPQTRSEGITATEFLLGEFGLEEVIVVDYTEHLFATTMFELYTGKLTWSEDEKRHFVAVQNNSNAASEDEHEIKFWQEIRIGIREFAVRRTQIPDRTVRLVLQGPSSLRPKVLSTLEECLGSLLPSPSHPLAVRIRLTEQEMRAKEAYRRRQSKIFTCVLWDQEGEWRVKDYEMDLLRSIYDADESWMDVKEGFIGSRGAALMGLHFLGLGCNERQRALDERKWLWDNERGSTYWYPDKPEPWMVEMGF